MNSACSCGSGKKFKKCCFLKNASIDEPHLRMGQLVLDNIWKRFPQSNTTNEYWLTKEELDAFNELLDLWLGFPASMLEEYGVKAASYNAISNIKHSKAVENLLKATRKRLAVFPTKPNYFRTLGELSRIFYSLRMALLKKQSVQEEGGLLENVPVDVCNCIDSFRNMVLMGVYGTTLQEFMKSRKHEMPLAVNDTILQSKNTLVWILVDITKMRVHEVPCMDPESDVLFWKRKSNLHYSSKYLGNLSDHIEAFGSVVLPTEWLCEQKLAHMKAGKNLSDAFTSPILTGQISNDNETKKNWVYFAGKDNSEMKYFPCPSFSWTITAEKDLIVGYLRYLSDLFSVQDGSAMSPQEWMHTTSTTH